MKKIALASAVAVASMTAAHAAPTVYGKAFLTLDYVDTNYDSNYKVDKKTPNDESTFKLNSNTSRIGLKGSEDLTDTTNLVYQLEYGIDVDADTNGKGQFYSRNTYLGLANNQYGTIIAGRHDTPFKLARGNVDVFNNNSATLSIDQVGPKGFVNLGENRANNIVAYKSPTIVGTPISFMGAVSLSETDADGNVLLKAGSPAVAPQPIYDKDDKNKLIGYTKGSAAVAPVYSEKKTKDNGYSAMLNYDQNGVYLAAGYDNNISVEDSAWRIVGSVDMGKMNMVNGLVLGALYQQADIYDNNDDAKTWLISGRYKLAETPWTVKAQYINTDFGSNDASEIALGGEYAFNKAAIGHVYVGKVDRDNYKDDTIVGGGIEYKF